MQSCDDFKKSVMEKNIKVYMYNFKYVLIQTPHSNPPEGSRCTKYVEFSFTENVKKLKNHTSFVMTIYGCIPPPHPTQHTHFSYDTRYISGLHKLI